MAQIPTAEEVVTAQAEAARKIDEKREAQEAEGKSFIVPDDGHAAGVVPEDVWRELKS